MSKFVRFALIAAAVGVVLALPACQTMDKGQGTCAACGGKGCEKCMPAVCEACGGKGCPKCQKMTKCDACGGKGCPKCQKMTKCDACGGKGCPKCKPNGM